MQYLLIILSNLLALLAYLIYEWSIFRGQTRPHRTTRFVLMIITILGASSLFAESDRVAFWLITMMAVNSIFLFFISLKYGTGGWSKFDISCLVIAALGIAFWKLTNNPALALYAAVIADFVGMVPTLIKTYRFPESEYGLFFLFDVAATLLTLLALDRWQLQFYLYPFYLLIINIVMTILIQRPKLAQLITNF